jgi:hypothetical protein
MKVDSRASARCNGRSVSISALLGVLLMLATASPANARWGQERCSLVTHCYAVTAWAMKDPPESVKGAEDIPTTTSMNVPEYYNQATVSNEMWVSFANNQGGWLEVGQLAGRAVGNCCTLHPFIAHALREDGYGYEEYIWWNVNAEARNIYKIEDPAANGSWCQYIWSINWGCHSHPGYWATYADDLEAGIEAASDSRPYNGGSQEVDAVAHDGSHRAWTGSQTSATGELKDSNGRPLPGGVMCETPNWSSNYPGNATWWIC